MEIELHRGIWITGKVTDKKTGHPIKGVPLHYLPFLENKFAQATPEFGPNRSVLVIVRDRYKTKPDGTYRLVGLPGRAIVGVALWDRVPYRYGYGADSIEGKDEHGRFATWWNPFPAGEASLLSMKEIKPPERAEVVNLDLQLDPGASVRVRVVDRDGKPLPGTGVIRRMSTSNLETMPEAEFDVVALGPGEERGMVVWHEGLKLGKAVHIHAGADKEEPVIVKLELLATIIGRVADADGNPISGAAVRTRMLSLGAQQPFATGSGNCQRWAVPGSRCADRRRLLACDIEQEQPHEDPIGHDSDRSPAGRDYRRRRDPFEGGLIRQAKPGRSLERARRPGFTIPSRAATILMRCSCTIEPVPGEFCRAVRILMADVAAAADRQHAQSAGNGNRLAAKRERPFGYRSWHAGTGTPRLKSEKQPDRRRVGFDLASLWPSASSRVRKVSGTWSRRTGRTRASRCRAELSTSKRADRSRVPLSSSSACCPAFLQASCRPGLASRYSRPTAMASSF